MKDTGIVRVIDEFGRIVFPKSMRKKLGLEEGTPLEIFLDGEDIIIHRHPDACVFCASEVGVTEFKGKKICSACLNDLKG